MKTQFKAIPALVLGFMLSAVVTSAAAEEKENIVAEPNLQVFTVLAAINAAGYNEGADKPELAPLRAAVRKELAASKIPSLPALREYYQRHKLTEPGRDLSQYVSLALFLGPPPAFQLQGSGNSLPPEIGDFEDMVPLIAAFYQEANIAALWEKYQPAMEQESDRYRKFLSKVILETGAYLRIDMSAYSSRKFAVYISPLGAPNQTNARSYGDTYCIVVGPAAELPSSDILHGWLHYLLDAYPYKYWRSLDSKAELQKITKRIPALDAEVLSDFNLQVTESLIRAIQARRSGASAQEQKRAVDDAVESGYYLTAYFFEAIQAFEKQAVGMRLYYPDMIDGISVKKEQERLSKVQFRAPAAAEFREAQQKLWSPIEQMVRQGEDSIARGQYEQARQILEDLNKEYGQQPRALYDLAVVATIEKQPETAKQYFTQAAGLSADPHIKAWSHIYLGRLLDVQGSRDEAKSEYSAALAAGDPGADTRAAAEKGLQQEFSSGAKADNATSAPQPEEEQRQRVPLGKD